MRTSRSQLVRSRRERRGRLGTIVERDALLPPQVSAIGRVQNHDRKRCAGTTRTLAGLSSRESTAHCLNPDLIESGNQEYESCGREYSENYLLRRFEYLTLPLSGELVDIFLCHPVGVVGDTHDRILIPAQLPTSSSEARPFLDADSRFSRSRSGPY